MGVVTSEAWGVSGGSCRGADFIEGLREMLGIPLTAYMDDARMIGSNMLIVS
jgi:hypothetical protein